MKTPRLIELAMPGIHSELMAQAHDAMEGLARIPLFASVGTPSDGTDAVFLRDWDHAIKALTSYQSIEQYRIFLNYLDREAETPSEAEPLTWRTVFSAICPHVAQLVRRKFQSRETRVSLVGVYNEDIFPDVVSDFALIVLGRILKMGDASRLLDAKLDWYRAGRFPCGWQGQFPEAFNQSPPTGKLLVF